MLCLLKQDERTLDPFSKDRKAGGSKRASASTTNATSFHCFFVILLCLSFGINSTIGFASWLKCFVDLDPSEVIMWQKVIPASEASHLVLIEIQMMENPIIPSTPSMDDIDMVGSHLEEEPSLSPSPSPSPVSSSLSSPWLSKSSATTDKSKEESLVLAPPQHPGTPMTLRVRLLLPPSFMSTTQDDVQYVMEVQTSIADRAAEAVEFIDRGVMCDGKRAFSRRHDEYVILQIDSDAKLEYIDLVAGWAYGMHAVTLTPVLRLQLPLADTTTTTTTTTTTISPTLEAVPVESFTKDEDDNEKESEKRQSAGNDASVTLDEL